jgi:hypothetical protein
MVLFREKIVFHKTYMADLTQDNFFEFDGDTYNIPTEKALHYFPSVLDVPRRLGRFFSKHKTLASLFDWFKLGKKSSHELGFIYEYGVSNPLDLNRFNLGHDFAKDNWNLRHNRSVSGHYSDIDNKLKGVRSLLGSWKFLAFLIIAIVIIVTVALLVNGGVLNSSPTPTPTPPAFNGTFAPGPGP